MRKFAFLPGAVMVVAAVLWAALAARWTAPVSVLLGGGILALAVGVAANWKGVREWFGDPRGVFALNTALSTLLLVAALVLVNALVGLRGVSFDWTEAGRNTLAPETRRAPAGPRDRCRAEADGQAEGPGVARPPRRILGAESARARGDGRHRRLAGRGAPLRRHARGQRRRGSGPAFSPDRRGDRAGAGVGHPAGLERRGAPGVLRGGGGRARALRLGLSGTVRAGLRADGFELPGRARQPVGG